MELHITVWANNYNDEIAREVVDGRRVAIDGFETLDLYLHKAVKDLGYRVTEPLTGMWIGSGETEEDAIKDASTLLNRYGLEGVWGCIESELQKTGLANWSLDNL